MPKTYSASHSLWPEQARPRSAKSSALAIGSFCIGVVAAFSAHNVLSDLFVSPPQEMAQQSIVADVPAYALAAPPAVTPPATPKAAEPANTRSRLAVQKLPTIGALPPPAAGDTDGRGGATNGRTSETPADVAAVASTPPSPPPAKMAEIAKPADEPSAAPAEPQQKPAARDRAQKQRSAHKRRDNSQHARNRNNPFFPFFGFFGQRG